MFVLSSWPPTVERIASLTTHSNVRWMHNRTARIDDKRYVYILNDHSLFIHSFIALKKKKTNETRHHFINFYTIHLLGVSFPLIVNPTFVWPAVVYPPEICRNDLERWDLFELLIKQDCVALLPWVRRVGVATGCPSTEVISPNG